jgi:hypothetical protein
LKSVACACEVTRPGKLFTANSALFIKSMGRLKSTVRQKLLTAVVALFAEANP